MMAAVDSASYGGADCQPPARYFSTTAHSGEKRLIPFTKKKHAGAVIPIAITGGGEVAKWGRISASEVKRPPAFGYAS